MRHKIFKNYYKTSGYKDAICVDVVHWKDTKGKTKTRGYYSKEDRWRVKLKGEETVLIDKKDIIDIQILIHLSY